MSGPEAKSPAPAGISAPDDLDVTDLFERLREELRRGAGSGGGAESEFAATRALAERFWPVTAEREAGGGAEGFGQRGPRQPLRLVRRAPPGRPRGFQHRPPQPRRPPPRPPRP